uniref:Uncharacterized protein n=1 Tax=Knipowitschia caucasica TaxID=637954 RepID=A0AAV2J972_KNICA
MQCVGLGAQLWPLGDPGEHVGPVKSHIDPGGPELDEAAVSSLQLTSSSSHCRERLHVSRATDADPQQSLHLLEPEPRVLGGDCFASSAIFRH